MSDIERYRGAVRTAHMCAQMLQVHDLSSLIQAIDRSASTGVFLDPTLYREKHQAMMEDRKVLVAALALVKAAVPGGDDFSTGI